MRLIKAYTRIADSINEWIGRIFSWLVLILMLFTVLEVVMRRLFNSPTIWSFETCIQIYAFNFMIAAAYTLLHGSHVSIDILYEKLSIKRKAIVDIISYILFFFPFTIIILWKGYDFARMSWETNETSWSVFAPPLYYIKTVIPITGLLLIIQGISIFIKKVLTSIGREDILHD